MSAQKKIMNMETEVVQELIEMLHNSPALWDPRNEDYGNKHIRTDELTRMAQHFKISPRDVAKKIKSLRTQFWREHKRKITSMRKGYIGKNRQWFRYNSLCFLLTISENTETIESETPIEIKFQPISDNDTEDSDTTQSSKPAPNSNAAAPTTTTVVTPYRRIWPKPSAKAAALKRKAEQAERDGYIIYGENVASRLRNAKKSSREVAVARNGIDNILFKLEMGELDETTSSHCAGESSEAELIMAFSEFEGEHPEATN